MPTKNKSWENLGSTLLHKTRIFDLYSRRMRSPSGDYEDDFYYLETIDWVNIIPITPENEVVLIKQFRMGIQSPTLEIPGGTISSPDELPELAAVRELQEETGYAPNAVTSLGWIHPNPAIQGNRCHFFMATGCTLLHPQNLDPAEDITVHLYPLEKIPELIINEEITHTLVVSAFCRMFFSGSGKFGVSR